MVLKRLGEEARKRRGRRVSEIWEIGGDCSLVGRTIAEGVLDKERKPVFAKFGFPKGYRDVCEYLDKNLGGYLEGGGLEAIQRQQSVLQPIGGDIPDDVWVGVLRDGKERDIELKLIQRYAQPGRRIYYARVVLDYDFGVCEKDIWVVGEVLEKGGFRRKEG